MALENRSTVMADDFIREYMDDVLRSVRMQVLEDILPCYSSVQLSYLAEVLL